MASRRRRILGLVIGGACLALVLAMGLVGTLAQDDEAERELMAFLRGDEDGSTDAERQAHIDRAIELAPDRARYFEVRAIFRIDHHDNAGAMSDLDTAISLEDRPYLRYLRGLTLCHRGEHARAVADFDHAIALTPDNTQFYRGRGLALIAVGRPADALLDADRMIRDAPQWGEPYFVRGEALRTLGRNAEAILAYDEALRRRPDLVYAWRARADAEDELGDAARALADREEAARRVPTSHPPGLDPYRY